MSARNIFSLTSIKRLPLLSVTILLLSGWCFGQATIKLSATSGPPTYSMKVSGSNFSPATAVNIYFDATQLTSATSDSTGSFSSIPIKIPASALPGTHYITATATSTNAKAGYMVRTNWIEGGFDSLMNRLNPYENVINPGNAHSLKQLWSWGPTFGYAAVSTPAVANGLLYYVASNRIVASNRLYAIDAKTASFHWSYITPETFCSDIAVGWGKVYIGSTAGLFAFDAKTGAVLWRYSWTGSECGSPSLWNGTVYIKAADGRFLAINASTGALLWSYLTDFPNGTPAVASNAVYIGGRDKLYALNPKTGALLWSYAVGTSQTLVWWGSPSVANGIVYLGLRDSTVVALDACTGSLRWSYKIPGYPGGYPDLFVWSSPAIANGIVYVLSGSNTNEGSTIYAFNGKTGTVVWHYTIPGRPSIVGPTVANGVIYIPGSTEIALDASTGALLWSYYGSESTLEAGAVVANGMLYIVQDSGKIDVFGL